mmetsp:Transcript_5111/g.7785  ORF Transcript_5111/g.7785 Transcript_5111/m.7785 type:complete len:353 (+) Transcript_5111:1199-2257(+)
MDPVCVVRNQHPACAVCWIDEPGSSTSGAINEYDSKYLIGIGDSRGGTSIWDTYTRRSVMERTGAHCNHYGVLALSYRRVNDTELLISQGRDGFIVAWEFRKSPESLAPLWQLHTQSQGFCKHVILGHMLACTSQEEDVVQLWDIKTQELTATLDKCDDKTGMCMALQIVCIGEESFVLALYENGVLYTFSLKTQEWLPSTQLQLFENVPVSFDVTVTKTKVHGVACGADCDVVAFSLDMRNLKSKVISRISIKDQGANDDKKGFSQVCIRHDCRLFVCAGWDGSIRVFDWKKLKPLGVLRYHKSTINSLAFSSDNKYMVSCSEDSHCAIWSLYPPASAPKSKPHTQTSEAM